MEYEGQICRAPMERGSFMLPVAVGCSYNRCRFCMLFRHLKWRSLPLSQVEAELHRVKAAGGAPHRIFLGDGNAFDLPFDHLMDILQLIHRYFPAVEGINMDATVTGVSQKSDDELRALAEAGADCLYLGIESGLEDVLRFMNKDHTMAQAEEQIKRLHDFGLSYAAHIMTGVAGKGRGEENARALAAFVDRTAPRSITNFSLFLHRESPLGKDIAEGRFRPADELENLLEERALLSGIGNTQLDYDGFHDVIPVRIRGKLPRDKEILLRKLDEAIERQKEIPPVYAFVD